MTHFLLIAFWCPSDTKEIEFYRYELLHWASNLRVYRSAENVFDIFLHRKFIPNFPPVWQELNYASGIQTTPNNFHRGTWLISIGNLYIFQFAGQSKQELILKSCVHILYIETNSCSRVLDLTKSSTVKQFVRLFCKVESNILKLTFGYSAEDSTPRCKVKLHPSVHLFLQSPPRQLPQPAWQFLYLHLSTEQHLLEKKNKFVRTANRIDWTMPVVAFTGFLSDFRPLVCRRSTEDSYKFFFSVTYKTFLTRWR